MHTFCVPEDIMQYLIAHFKSFIWALVSPQSEFSLIKITSLTKSKMLWSCKSTFLPSVFLNYREMACHRWAVVSNYYLCWANLGSGLVLGHAWIAIAQIACRRQKNNGCMSVATLKMYVERRGGDGLALPLPVDLKQEGGTRRVKGVDGGKGWSKCIWGGYEKHCSWREQYLSPTTVIITPLSSSFYSCYLTERRHAIWLQEAPIPNVFSCRVGRMAQNSPLSMRSYLTCRVQTWTASVQSLYLFLCTNPSCACRI